MLKKFGYGQMEKAGVGDEERFIILRLEGTECSDMLKARKCLQTGEQG